MASLRDTVDAITFDGLLVVGLPHHHGPVLLNPVCLCLWWLLSPHFGATLVEAYITSHRSPLALSPAPQQNAKPDGEL